MKIKKYILRIVAFIVIICCFNYIHNYIFFFDSDIMLTADTVNVYQGEKLVATTSDLSSLVNEHTAYVTKYKPKPVFTDEKAIYRVSFLKANKEIQWFEIKKTDSYSWKIYFLSQPVMFKKGLQVFVLRDMIKPLEDLVKNSVIET